MSEHDELCPRMHCDWPEKQGNGDCYGYEDCMHQCQCELIAKVRAVTVAQCIDAVEALIAPAPWAGLYLARDALRSLQDNL